MTNYRYSMYLRKDVATIQQYMDNNPAAHRTCAEVWAHNADIMNRSLVEKAFKDLTGYKMKAYLVKVRLEYSQQYLKEGMPIKRVAAKSLYRSQSAYCTAFKRHYKQSPTAWLKDGRL